MTLPDAQKEMRDVFVNGATGPLVSGVIWLVAAALETSVPRPSLPPS